MSESYEIFQVVVDEHKLAIDSGSEVEIPVKDLEVFSKIKVRAVLSEAEFPGSTTCRIVNDMGEKKGKLFIKVTEVVEEE